MPWQALLDAGADVNAVAGFYRETPLHKAAQEGHTEVVTWRASCCLGSSCWSLLQGDLCIAWAESEPDFFLISTSSFLPFLLRRILLGEAAFGAQSKG